MNKFIGIGRIARDIDVRYSQGDNPVCIAKYCIAIDRERKNANGEKETDFLNCTALGRQGEFAEKYLQKGMKICVEGRIQTGSFTDRDGNKRNTFDIMVEKHEFVEKKADAPQNAQNGQNRQEYSQQTSYRQKPQNGFSGESDAFKKESMSDGFMSIPDDVNEESLPWN